MTNTARAAMLLTISLLTGLLLGQTTFAEGNLEHGREIATTCFGCHGIDGYRNAYPSFRVPRLGGQTAQYIALALHNYRDGKRAHPTMQAQASSLSNQDILDVAAYLSSIDNDGVKAAAAKKSTATPPKQAATCSACHGATGISAGPTWPSLAGQHESYLVNALDEYRSGKRTDPIMVPLANSLSSADVDTVARYFAGFKGLETTTPD